MSTSTVFHKLIRAAAVAFGIALSGVALAQDDTGLYISGSLGRSDMDIGTSDAAAGGVTGISTDDTDRAWKINIGYQFNRHWAIEAGYVDFGDFEVKGTLAGTPVSAKSNVNAWTLAAVGTLPLGASAFSLFGKLGTAWGESDNRATGAAITATDSESGIDFFAGIGLRYDFNRNLGVQLEAEYYDFNDRVILYTLGLRYKF